jgi:hypothetical protein
VDSGLADCGIEPGQRIWLTLATADQLLGCRIPEGVIFSFSYNEDKIMPEASPEPIVAAAEPSVEAPAIVPVEAPVAVEPLPVQHAQALPTEALTEAPVDLTQLQGLAGGNPTLMVVLALIVVGGGGAAWKFWNKFSEQKHEQAMKRMEIDAQQAGLQGAQPPPCAVKQTEVDAKLASLEARLGKAEKASLGLPDDFNAEGLEKLVKKHEKDIVALKKSVVGKA